MKSYIVSAFKIIIFNIVLNLLLTAAAVEFNSNLMGTYFLDKIQVQHKEQDRVETLLNWYKEMLDMLPKEKINEADKIRGFTLVFQNRNDSNSTGDYNQPFFDLNNGLSHFERPLNTRVLGFDNNSALKFSGYTNLEALDGDDPCGNNHNYGDIANTFCHAGVSKLVYKMALENGVSENLAQLGGVSVFLVKELTDKNYDLADVTTAPIKIIKKCHVTFALDGSAYLECENRF